MVLQHQGNDHINVASVYSAFSDRIGLPLHNIPSTGVLMKRIGAYFCYDLMTFLGSTTCAEFYNYAMILFFSNSFNCSFHVFLRAHTAVKICPHYDNTVVHVLDASTAVVVV